MQLKVTWISWLKFLKTSRFFIYLIVKKFILYLIRWQLSTPILAPVIYLFSELGVIPAAMIANLIGGMLFYFVDKKIFKNN